MNITAILESLLFGGAIPPQAPLPEPPEKRVAKPVQVKTAGARLVSRETRTWEWDIARSRPAGADATLTDVELETMQGKGLKNSTWNVALKLARVQGATIAEAAKAAGCSFSYAQKAFAALSAFEAA